MYPEQGDHCAFPVIETQAVELPLSLSVSKELLGFIDVFIFLNFHYVHNFYR